MSAPITAAEQFNDTRPRRIAAPRTTTPDWLFSTVVHLLLIALLFTSKAGPGGGGGRPGAGGGGPADFPNDGWIEAQMGSEANASASAADSVVTLAIAPATDNEAVSTKLPAPKPQDVESSPPVSAIRQAAHVEPAETTAATPSAPPADASSTQSDTSGPGDGRQGPGIAGAGRGRGDGSPGNGGDGQGGTSLFGIWDSGERFVYLIDRSSSMQHYGKLAAARRELEASLAHLDEAIEFQVLYYNTTAHPLSIGGSTGLVRASHVNLNRARREIGLVTADGGTQHRTALQAALRLKPTVVYFLTDAEDPGLTADEVAAFARRLQGATRIHCIQFGDVPQAPPTADNWLQQLAAATGGQYLHFRTRELRAADGAPPIRR